MFPTLPSLASTIVAQPFKRAQLGLFHGKTKQYGNNVPFSKHKTRRTWLPNVQRKRLFSETLEGDVRTKVTTRALRTIKKHGGLDQYIKTTRSDLIGWEGMRIRVLLADKERQNSTESAELAGGSSLSKSTSPSSSSSPSEALSSPAKRTALQRLKQRKEPTLQSAQNARIQAAQALGLKDGVLASVNQTIHYLRNKPSLLSVLRASSERSKKQHFA